MAHVLINLEVGGAEVMVLNMCRWLKQNGHEPSVHGLFGTGPLAAQFEAAGVPVVTYPAKRGRLQMMWNIHQQFRANPVDVVHLHNVSPAVHAAIPARLAGVKRVFATRHSLVSPPYDKKAETQFSLAAKFCDAVIGVCDPTANNLRGAPLAGGTRIVTIPNGADPARSTNEQIRNDGRFTMVHVARLSPPKDQVTLLRATALATRQIPGLQLWIVGSGDLLESLRQLTRSLGIEQNVVFWGARTNVADYLNAAHVAVFSSISEGLPIAALEAMAARLPILTTDVGGTPDIVRRHQNGLVVPKSDPEALAAAMVDLERSPAKRAACAEASRTAYHSHFTSDIMNQSYLQLYLGQPVSEEAVA